MKRWMLGLLFSIFATAALAQGPGPGPGPQPTNGWIQSGGKLIPLSGLEVALNPSTAAAAGLNVGVGSAPTSPVNGDVWATSSGFFVRIGGSTYNLLTSAGVSTFGNASADTTLTITGTGSGPYAGNVTAKINLSNANTWLATQTFPNSSITNAELSNSTITLGSTVVTLGSTYSAINSIAIGTTTAASGKFTTLSFTTSLNASLSALATNNVINSGSGSAITWNANGGRQNSLSIYGPDGGSASIQLYSASNGSSGIAYSPYLLFLTSGGTGASPSAIINQQIIGGIYGVGYDGSSFDQTDQPAGCVLTATQNWSSGAHGSNITCYTTPNGSTGAILALTLAQDQSTTIAGNLITNVTGSTQCLHANSSGVVSGTGSDCGSGGSGVASLGNAGGDSSLTFTGTGSGPWTGTVTAKLNLSNTNTWAAAQTFPTSDIILGGSSTGTTTFASANAGATNYTITFPAANGTIALLSQVASLPLSQTNGGCGGANYCDFAGQVITTGLGTPTLAFPSSNYTYTFPGATSTLTYETSAPTSGHCAQWSGTSGLLADSGGSCGGSGSPGGSNTDIQFNNSGAFGGDSGLVYTGSGSGLTLQSGTGGNSVFSVGTTTTNTSSGNSIYLANDNASAAAELYALGSAMANTNFFNVPSEVLILKAGSGGSLALGTVSGVPIVFFTGGSAFTNKAGQIGSTNHGWCVGNCSTDLGQGALAATTLASIGSSPTGSGTCSVTSQTGGNTAGTFTASGACVAGTYILTFTTTASTGWACDALDRTTPSDTVKQTSSSTTTATFTSTTANSDVVQFFCMAY